MTLDISSYRQPLTTFIEGFLDQEKTNFENQYWATNVFAKLRELVPSGKLLRGSLCLLGYQLMGKSDITPILPLAASLEFMHSALLIHDDIIDNDSLRRGKPSMMAYYQALADKNSYPQAEQVGKNLAICVGDIGFFLGFKLFGQLRLETQAQQALLSDFCREFMIVGLGEMHDVSTANTPEIVTEAEIINVYRYKTARYTFSLPLLMAAHAADFPATETQKLQALGELLGLIFQIKDDELGLFGTEAEIGKPATSDAREGKKTLYYIYSLQLGTHEQRQQFSGLYGKADLTIADLVLIRGLVIATGAQDKVNDKLQRLEKTAQTLIDDLPTNWQTFFTHFLNYNLLRKM